MLSFDNTEIAFQYKSDTALDKGWWLFRFIASNRLVKFATPFAGLAVKLFPTRYVIRETLFSHFCGGENIGDCDAVISKLHKYHVGTILDYSVEGKESEADFDRTLKEILETQDRALLDDKVPFTVFKLTGMARFALLEKVSAGESLSEVEKHEFERVKSRVEKLCKKASETGIPIMLDAEETWIQPVLDQLILEMMRRFNTDKPLIYNTFQMYCHQRFPDLKAWYETAVQEGFYLGVKLVRGAYMEKERKRAAEKGYPSPIQPDKAATDRDYDAALEFMTERIDRIGMVAGTHNERSSLYLTQLMEQKSIRHDHPHVYFSQLLGMSDHISFNLAHAGYNVVKYVPYGPVKDVLPYLIRRAEENTSVAGQTGRELDLLSRERKRRKGR
jgi:proline dehydrogenase